jgi:hypothetical protein
MIDKFISEGFLILLLLLLLFIIYFLTFVFLEECEILRAHGKSRLTRATVAAEDGSSVLSEHRQANQACTK